MKRKDKLSDDKEALEKKYAEQRKEASKDTTSVQVIDDHFDFGNITEGEKVEFSFRFVNSGKNPMVIESATAGCGCTVPERPEAPIMPGDTGRIKVVFNSAGKREKQEKSITVVANVHPEFPHLLLTGNVLEKQ